MKTLLGEFGRGLGEFGRGRPRTSAARKVYDDLISAAERCLTEKRCIQLTAREIASAAGTNEAMIKYYFGSKDVLLSVVLQHQLSNMSADLADLEAHILELPGCPTWHLVKASARIAQAHLPSTILHSEERGSHTPILDECYRSFRLICLPRCPESYDC